MEDLSDRELEKFLQENVATKLFCGFQLDEKISHFTALLNEDSLVNIVIFVEQ